MHVIILTTLIVAGAAGAPYLRKDSYVDDKFFTKWRFFDQADPLNWAVSYVEYTQAFIWGLVNATSDRVYMGTDTTTKTAKGGRRSVRIKSTATYNEGLFVASLDHIPTGCGTWSSFWMYGEDDDHMWPTWGEFDIIEGVHRATHTSTSLHTSAGCNQSSVISGKDFSTKWAPGRTKVADDCDVHAGGQWENQGCVQSGPKASMGSAFNHRGGGTYAAEWDPEGGHIRTWFWSNGTEPADLKRGHPEPDSWGLPYSYFRLDDVACPASHFKNMRLVFDLNFCGSKGFATFEMDCPDVARMTCEELVTKHPEHMQEAFWSLRLLDVYQREGSRPSSSMPAMTRAIVDAPPWKNFSDAAQDDLLRRTTSTSMTASPTTTTTNSNNQHHDNHHHSNNTGQSSHRPPAMSTTSSTTMTSTTLPRTTTMTRTSSPPAVDNTTSKEQEVEAEEEEEDGNWSGPVASPPDVFATAHRRGSAAPGKALQGHKAPLPTNAWWQNVALARRPSSVEGNIFQMPYVVIAGKHSLKVMQPFFLQGDGKTFAQSFNEWEGLSLGTAEELEGPYVDAWDKLSVTMGWRSSGGGGGNGSGGMKMPLVRGSPYVTAEYVEQRPQLTTNQRLPVIEGQSVFTTDSTRAPCDGETRATGSIFAFHFQESDTTWFLFVPQGSEWICHPSPFAITATNRLSGAVRLAIANSCTTGSGHPLHCTGNNASATEYASLLRQHGGSYPVNATVDYNVTGDVAHITWTWGIRSLPGWPRVKLLQLAWPTHIARLSMRVLQANHFVPAATPFKDVRGRATAIIGDSWRFHHHLFPDVGLRATRPVARGLRGLIVNALRGGGALWNGSAADADFDLPRHYQEGVGDTYYSGKMVARLARLLTIADELGEAGKSYFQRLLSRLKARLEAWLKPAARTPFIYDATWGGLVSCGCKFEDCGGNCTPHCTNNVTPAEQCPALADVNLDFGNGFYNDHHFHYGYFVYGAAVVAKFDPVWERKWRAQIEALVRDYGNPSSENDYFPVARHMDWFMGFSWTLGIGGSFFNGRNQDSATEAVHGYYALYAYGAVVESPLAKELKDFARVLLALETDAVDSYWHVRANSKIYGDRIPGNTVGTLWEHMTATHTRFGATSYSVAGMQLLPFTPATEGCLKEQWVAEHFPDFRDACHRDPKCSREGWSWTVCMEQAVIDPKGALHCLEYLPRDAFEAANAHANGNSLTNSLYWIATRPNAGEVSASRPDQFAVDSVMAFRKYEDMGAAAVEEGKSHWWNPVVWALVATTTAMLLARVAAVASRRGCSAWPQRSRKLVLYEGIMEAEQQSRWLPQCQFLLRAMGARGCQCGLQASVPCGCTLDFDMSAVGPDVGSLRAGGGQFA